MPIPFFIDAGPIHFQASAGILTLGVPTVLNGDMLVAWIISADEGVGIGTPAGWTEVTDLNHGGTRLAIAVRLASSEPASYGFTCGASTQGIILGYRDADPVTPVNVFSALENQVSGISHTGPSVVTTGGGIVLSVFRMGSDIRGTPTVGIERVDEKADNETLSFIVVDIVRAVSGAGPSPAVDLNTAKGVFTSTLALQAAAIPLAGAVNGEGAASMSGILLVNARRGHLVPARGESADNLGHKIPKREGDAL